jgi:trehalose synthase
MAALSDVPVPAIDPGRFEQVVDAEQWRRFRHSVEMSARVFAGRVIWNVNSTAKGGGVAEMLNALLPYARGAGVDARWLVLSGDEGFFRVTKRLHNHLHGDAGDAPHLDSDDRAQYEAVAAAAAGQLVEMAGGGDMVVLHDPQTAGMIPTLRAAGLPVVWRCHVGVDAPNQLARDAWDFLLPYVREADATVFSRRAFAWDGLDSARTVVIAPSIDPFSPKNADMSPQQSDAVLAAARLVASNGRNDEAAEFRRQDGSLDRIRRAAAVTEEAPVPPDAELVVQVSRWDRLKDPAGVLDGFARGVAPRSAAHLLLAGPSVEEVADDPEGAATFADVRRAWKALPGDVRPRVHLASLPMVDGEENAAMVNALQRRATVVVQKSLAEGFGLTVAEAMWKGRPVVASRIGGIQDQVVDGVCGLLVDDPRDLDAFAAAVRELLADERRAAAMGEAARRHVQEHFLGTRHLTEHAELLAQVLQRHGAAVP